MRYRHGKEDDPGKHVNGEGSGDRNMDGGLQTQLEEDESDSTRKSWNGWRRVTYAPLEMTRL